MQWARATPSRVATALVAATMLMAGCTGDDTSAGSEVPGESEEREEPTSTTVDQAVSEIEPAEVRWGVCPFHVPAGVEIDCGMFDVPADHGEPDGETVTLPVAVVRSDHQSPAEDPIVYLSGGPGQSTLEPVPMTYGFLYEPLAESRDVILVDQRGTGFARPSLACDEYDGWIAESLGSRLDAGELAEQGVATLEECHQRLVGDGVDLSDYDSAASAADLELLRRSLGHDEWNLYGISYGTRLAQTILRDHPDGVRSVVLDSAYPLTADLYEEAPANAARAIDELFALCAADSACTDRYPDLESSFAALVDELDARPVPVEIVDASIGERVEDELDGAGLVGFVFQALYSTELAAHLPELIDGVAAGETGTVGVLLGALIQQTDQVSIGMQLAVQCREELAFGDPGSVESAAEDQPLVGRFFEGSPTLGPGVFDVCETWEAGAAAEVENEAVRSDVPTLVLAGSLDPITPPAWGRTVADHLESATVVELPATGHGVLASRECALAVGLEFLDDPGGAPNTTCVDEVEPPPFAAAEVEVEMVPFSSEELGVSGLRPEGWSEVAPGVFQESPLVSLMVQQVPGASTDQLMQQLTIQLGMDTPPEPVGQQQSGGLSWDLFELEDLGQRVDLAVAEHEGGLWLVQLVSTPERHDVHSAQVFAPAVDAFDPVS